MQLIIIGVGRLKEKPYRQMADEYLKRLSRFAKMEEIEIPDLSEPEHSSPALEKQLKDREGAGILQKLRPTDHVIALAIDGVMRSSEETARVLEKRMATVSGRLVFVLGGSLGLSDDVLARADEKWSMSPMTFPHQLARVMLLEQLYRSMKILAGERYHK